MAKKNGRSARTQEYREEEFGSPVTKLVKDRFRLKCKNEAQKEFSRLITDKEIVIAAGPAGTGKSYVAIARAIELLQNVSNPYSKVVISKPAVEAEEKLGFVPGTIREKLEPHLASSLDIVDKIMGRANRKQLEDHGYLAIQPLGFIRGKTLDNSIIIIEEAQNLSPKQCQTILSRIGYGSKLIISGDLDQSDRYSDVRQSGLYDLFARHRGVEEVGFYEFQVGDIVRNPLIGKLLANYEKQEIPNLSDIKPKKAGQSKPANSRVIPDVPKKDREKVQLGVDKDDTSWFSGIRAYFSKNFAW